METSAKDDLSALYENMARYDFRKPIRVSVIEDLTDFVSNSVTNTAQEEQIRNSAIYRKENEVTSVYWQNDNVTRNFNNNKENFNNNTLDITTLNSQNETTTSSNSKTGTPLNWVSEVLFTKNQDTIPSHQPCNKQSFVSSESSQSNRDTYNNQQFIHAQDQLNRLSMNLVNVLISYNNYICISKNTRLSYSQIHNARMKYETSKQYYYGNSREIFMRLLLPQRNNHAFIGDFLEKIRNIAINQKNLHCTYKDVEIIFKDFVNWASMNSEMSQNPVQNTHSQSVVSNANMAVSSLRYYLENNNSSNNTHRHENSVNGGLSVDGSSTCLFSYGNPGNEMRLTVNTDVLNSINRKGHSQEYINYENNTNKLQGHNETFQSCRNIPSETNAAPIRQSPARSVSRDSGFISPFNRQNDDCCIEGQADQETAPYITHVTSLNPNASHVPPGLCDVCGARALVKCVACFKVYYCSPRCQSLDWITHRATCSRYYC